jgi:hypothetical protein
MSRLFNDVATALLRGVDSLLVLLAALVLLATIAWLCWLMVSDRLDAGGTDHTEAGRAGAMRRALHHLEAFCVSWPGGAVLIVLWALFLWWI